MAAVTLLFVSAVVNGASVAVDSKSGTEAAQPDTAQLDTDAAQSKKLEVEASVAEGHDSTDPRIGLYTQQIVNLESVGPIGANQAFYLTTSDGYGQPAGGYPTSYGASMPAYSNFVMGPPPSNQYSYSSYQMPSAYPQPQPVPSAPVYTGSLYGNAFNNPPPSYSPAYAPSYTTPPPQTAQTVTSYPPPAVTNPPPPAQTYTEAYPTQPVTQQPPYNTFTPYTFNTAYGVNNGFSMVPGYGAASAPVSPTSFATYGASIPSYGSYSAQVAQVPYGSPLPAFAPMQTSAFAMPMSAVPYGVDANRIPEAYVSTGMGGFASYGPVNTASAAHPMSSFPTMTSFVPLSSGSSAPVAFTAPSGY